VNVLKKWVRGISASSGETPEKPQRLRNVAQKHPKILNDSVGFFRANGKGSILPARLPRTSRSPGAPLVERPLKDQHKAKAHWSFDRRHRDEFPSLTP
jgi:hypothetical protein